MTRTEQIIRNLSLTAQRIDSACARSGRNPLSVQFMVVTKYAMPEDIPAVLSFGAVKHIGESRVQDSARRWQQHPPGVNMHFIGHLQSNKAAKAAQMFDFVDSLDSAKTAEALARQAGELGKKIKVLVQINATGNPAQSGAAPYEAQKLTEAIRKMPTLQAAGYMVIAPVAKNPEELRPLFKSVKSIFDHDYPQNQSQAYLSMGMSGDFETAVEEGSTLPRIGSAIFPQTEPELKETSV